MEVKTMFGEINALFDTAVTNGTAEFVGLLLLCAKIYAGYWVLKTLINLIGIGKKGK